MSRIDDLLNSEIRTSASSAGRSVNSRDVAFKPNAVPVPVPIREIDAMESIACGFRMQLISMEDPITASVMSGGGCGNEFITMQWGDRRAVVRATDLLASWVETFDIKAAGEIRNAGESLHPKKKRSAP